VSDNDILPKVVRYYAAKVRAHGATAEGAGWKDTASQRLRFEVLSRLFGEKPSGSLLDYGCGWGALADWLVERGFSGRYTGYDASAEIAQAARDLQGRPAADIGRDLERVFLSELPGGFVADYVVASGLFNVRLDVSDDAWLAYLENTLDDFHAASRRGFGFNVLSQYSDPAKRRPDLYYADPLALFDRCKRRYSSRVALLHDYPLWEFTMLVWK
jgi:Methyltransferase domain